MPWQGQGTASLCQNGNRKNSYLGACSPMALGGRWHWLTVVQRPGQGPTQRIWTRSRPGQGRASVRHTVFKVGNELPLYSKSAPSCLHWFGCEPAHGPLQLRPAAPNLPPTTPPHPQRQRGREGRPANGNASDESSLASRVQTAAAPPSEPCGLLLSNPQHGDEFCRRRPERFGGHSIHSIHNARGHSKETKFAQVFDGAICRSHMLIWGYQVTLV